MEILEIVADQPLFSGLGRSALREIAAAAVIEQWSRKCAIPADDAQRFRAIVRGRVKITRSHPHSGRELTLWLLGPGDAFDVVALLDGQPHAISAWTLDDVETLAMPAQLFRRWLERFPALRLNFYRYVARRLRQLIDLASDEGLHDTMTRLARLLLRHFDSAQSGGPGNNLIRGLPQEELAAMIGSVRVVVSRLLSHLRGQGAVNLDKGVVRGVDLRRLQRLAEAHLHGRAADGGATRLRHTGSEG